MAKPIFSLSFNVTWDQVYSDTGFFRKATAATYVGRLSYLSKGVWQPSPTDVPLNINFQSALLNATEENLIDGNAAMTLENPEYRPGLRNGFLKLELGADFAHEAYPAELTRATVAMAQENTALPQSGLYNYMTDASGYEMPKLPYLPTIREIGANYVTTLGAPAGFYHVAPFGQAAREAAGATLLPPLDYEAALFVGVEDFAAPARLSLLMQVANGSGDPLLEVPGLSFHYLAGDAWTALLEQEVDDKTGNLAASAVLGLALPEAADSGHGLMPSGLHWLRLAAPQVGLDELLDGPRGVALGLAQRAHELPAREQKAARVQMLEAVTKVGFVGHFGRGRACRARPSPW